MKIVSFGLGVPAEETTPEILGGKGAGLVWMDQQGVPVPPGFIIPTTECVKYMKSPDAVMVGMEAAIEPWLAKLEAHFGYKPLLSVRSGARKSMPGMMDTILNVGMEPENAKEWITRLGPKCAADSRRRLIEMYGSVVNGIERKRFEGKTPAEARDLYGHLTGQFFPKAKAQLVNSIEAVFKSWNNERAKVYRQLNGISDEWGTAVVVQAMVFGNLNDQSATGVLFTRDPNSGVDVITGEFLVNAQGEDVVAGIRTPKKLQEMFEWNPEVYNKLLKTVTDLETAKKDVQDVEFTVQDGKLFILQTRNAKRSSPAAVRIAVEMAEEGLVTPQEAFKLLTLKDFLRAQAPVVDPTFFKSTPPAFSGITGCNGLVTGLVAHTSEEAVKRAKEGVILVTEETTPDDIAGMNAALGVLTINGGATSHAAVVARSMNKPTIVGLGETSGAKLSNFPVGQQVSMDGASGRVWWGTVPSVGGEADPYVAKLTGMMAAQVEIAGFAGQTEGDLLDVSELSPKEALATVQKALATKEMVAVDTRPGTTPAHKVFAIMFPGAHTEGEKVATLAKGLKPAQRKRVKIISSLSVPAFGTVEDGPYLSPAALAATLLH